MFYRGPFCHSSASRTLASVGPLLPMLMAQAVWWAAILTGVQLAALAFTAQLMLALWLDRAAMPSLRRWLLFVSSGLALDALTTQLGLIRFRDGETSVFPLGIPDWLVLLWLSFSLTIPRLQQWLPPPAQQGALFAAAAVLAYFAGAAFAAADISQPVLYGAVLIAGWLILVRLWQPRRTDNQTRIPIATRQRC